jgi:predicted site-specific integrase-resolvase
MQIGMNETARRLAIGVDTLKRWCDAGKIEHQRDYSGRRVFESEVIDKLAEERKAKATR